MAIQHRDCSLPYTSESKECGYVCQLPLFDTTCPSIGKWEEGQCVPDVQDVDRGTCLPPPASLSSVLLSPLHRCWLIVLGCPVLTGGICYFPWPEKDDPDVQPRLP